MNVFLYESFSRYGLILCFCMIGDLGPPTIVKREIRHITYKDCPRSSWTTAVTFSFFDDLNAFYTKYILNILESKTIIIISSHERLGSQVELIVYPSSRCPSIRPSSASSVGVVVHNAQRSSFPKPLGRSKPNFMWSLLG